MAKGNNVTPSKVPLVSALVQHQVVDDMEWVDMVVDIQVRFQHFDLWKAAAATVQNR